MDCTCCQNRCEHHFEPRYDVFEGQPDIGIAEAGKFNNSCSAREFLDGVSNRKQTTYLFDICVKCGKKIER